MQEHLPFCCSISGVCCTDWSLVGSKQKDAGKTEPAHIAWLAGRKAAAKLEMEDAYFFECTPTYPVEDRQKKFLEATHEVVHTQWSPHEGGFGMRRPRVFAAGISKSSTVWTGPHGPDVEHEFKRWFSLSMEGTGALWPPVAGVQRLAI